MNLETLEWDPFLFSFFELPIQLSSLAKIHSSCEVYGKLAMTEIKVSVSVHCIGILSIISFRGSLGTVRSISNLDVQGPN